MQISSFNCFFISYNYLLPKSIFTKLFVFHFHLLLKHAGSVTVFYQIRLTHWIFQGRKNVIHIIRQFCFSCRKLNVKPFALPTSLPLLIERVQLSPIFTHTSVDYFSPFLITKGLKIWVFIFMCLSSRAIHLEIAEILFTEVYIDAFLKLVARRGKPLSMISDNGTKFVLTRKLVKPSSQKNPLRLSNTPNF